MRDLAIGRWWRRDGASLHPDGTEAAASARLERARGRLLATGAVLLLCFGAVVVRTLDVAVIGAPIATAGAGGVAAFNPAARADIVDRNGVLLASNLPTHALYVEPAKIFDRAEAVAALGRVFPDLDPARTASLVASDRRTALLRHNVTPEQAHAINRLGIPGLWLERQEQRFYPQGRLFAHAVGFTDVDNRGLAGVEKAANEELPRRAAARQGPLTLSLDIRVQHVLAEALAETMTAHRALGAAGMVMDVASGELLALVSLPAFDPKGPDRSTEEQLFNRATLGTYELGSTLKPFTVAMALDHGVAGLEDSYDATEPIRVARHLIRDHRPENRWLTVPEILIHSSNIGAAKLAVDVGAERQKSFLDAFGMFKRMPLESSERGWPIVPRRWSQQTTMTVGFGHGLAVTPLHLIASYATLVNGGIAVTPTLIRQEPGAPQAQRRVISAETSAIMRMLLYAVVSEGTGRKAAVPGYLVGGKTGTAEKVVGGKYKRDSMITNFVGVFPIDRPRYAVLTLMDEPKGTEETFGFATAGWTAAPVAGRVIERIAPILGIPSAIEPEETEDAPSIVWETVEGGRHASL
ncbi:MAG: penicillin-binding protein 2 [Rhodospirillales bacterium]|nr:penicillin-binding protein 2 [Rhodospirillales bacterium]MDE0381168.1 penicillin-binding protein 2 [Rhodospirillales bacterium]